VLLRGADGRFSGAGVRALGELSAAGVPYVFVSGRAAAQLRETARILGAAGALPELGALDAGYPVRAGQSVFEAIGETGVPDEILARFPALRRHDPQVGRREGSHCYRGVVGPEVAAWVAERSGGALRFVDNGVIGPGQTRVWHLVPAAAGKAASVARDIAVRGAERAGTLAVGDSPEDLELASVVGRFVLVGNALAGRGGHLLRADGVRVTGGRYGAGVLEAVREWLADG
jgi:phosphoglycolate phosphatase